MKYIISAEESGKTVKEILSRRIGLSNALIKHLKFLDDGILLDGDKVTVRRIVNEGDVLELAVEDKADGEQLTPTDIPLDIVFEDEYMVVPNKPPFMPTHPSHLHHGDTLADALAFRYKSQKRPFVFRPINRLDRNTSGLTLIAKDRISAARLAEAMRNGKINKQYIAVLDGRLPESEGIIETYMKRSQNSIIVRTNCGENEGGDYALTRYRVLSQTEQYSLVLASPLTGRTHQLRVHFAGLGCAIVGDDIYGHTDERINRHALHAISLSLLHPRNSIEMQLTAPLPDDMHKLISTLFGEAALEDITKKII